MNDESLMLGLERGFLDYTVPANADRIPQFISNDPSRGEKVITTMREEMRNCDSFMFSVAFITYDGVNALLEEFKYLRDHGIPGKILTSQYQNFTEPKAIRKIQSLGNIEIKIVTEEQMKMHSKCYIFSRKGTYDVIIGSSNLTNNALCSNGEWNVRFNSLSTGELVKDIIDSFEKVFEHAMPITDQWMEVYEEIYDRYRFSTPAFHDIPAQNNGIRPNKMQEEALRGLQEIRNRGGTRALVISATGSGKTYLSAFDAKAYGGRFLYLVHRRPILNKSFESFRRVLGSGASMAKYDSSQGCPDEDYIFATVQTMSNPEVYRRIPRDRFDYIMIDEVHHIGAPTYQAIVDYFEPSFLAGMTATPDRSDGFDIYGFFHHNIAYEIRLKQAMEYNLVCPFHYFGISDIEVGGVSLDDVSRFSDIEFEKRVEYVIDNAEFYGHGGDRLRGLAFCSTLKEAEMFSTMFNRRGYRTAWVSGSLDKDVLEILIERLESDEEDYALDYIFAVDLFNEGVDIPSVNQVIMLRPTESPIVYIQQLGRGLRLDKGKDFVTVLDFIGNYDKNYNIPIALSDDHSYSKIEARRFVASGDSIIYGNSTISFDEVSKAKIYESIDKASFSKDAILVEAYMELKSKLGRIPKLIEFRKYGSMDVLNILSKYNSYHNFLKKKDKDYHTAFSPKAEEMLEYLTKIIAPGKRVLEVEVLKMICSGGDSVKERIEEMHPELDQNALNNIVSVFDGTFYKNDIKLISENKVCDDFLHMMEEAGFKEAVQDLMDLGLDNNTSYSPLYRDTNFVLNRMYTYDDVCRLMNWKANVNAQTIGGYKFDKTTNTFSIFINYVKGEDVVESQRYDDHFENRNTLIAFSKSTESKGAKNMVCVGDQVNNDVRIHLFVRKNKKDEGSKEFYYLGELDFVSFMNDEKPVKIMYRLKDEVRSDLFDYFNS
ncbi:DUF3427 domain-containing protein [Methanomethylophilus alvi]|uniref:DUF3427 domain-containing protein n=1 Tax=Methanomethylophilus alvi TaxID=1291540 RepID=UPI0037DDCC61